ncbi:wall-associated receptor kinase-like 8 [Apium graveolens]|uniref:wall-associated receptor kinase-like 8 n=1 Tax=Apium graveolens TaxID=4045 RepID=UPI003D794839
MGMQLVILMILVLVFSEEVSAAIIPGCPDKCGNFTIPYPFGIGSDCALDWRIKIYCNKTFDPPKPFLYYNQLEVLNISLEGTIQVKSPIFKDCTNGSRTQQVVFVYNPFGFSETKNIFIAMGCNNLALINTETGSNLGGCMSFCNTTTRDKHRCFGINCCQTIIPPSFWNFSTSLRTIDPFNGQDLCKYAFIVDQNWFVNLPDIYSVQHMEQVPAVLDWKLNLTDDCYPGRASYFPFYIRINSSVCGNNTNCINQSCYCKHGYEGNPYLRDGCQDIDECANPYTNNCQQICNNTLGGYDCLCNKGWEASGMYNCTRLANDKRARMVIEIASCTILGVLLVLAATWWLCKLMKRRKLRQLKEKNFEKNGGLLLCQQVSSSEGIVDTTKLFTSKELDMATDNYNKNRILGQGGQGTVYKGMLTDGRIVAVKKSRIEDDSKKQQFINEVVLLSKINHRNIVKLHGCCLETDVPLLVYEFIPNGTLFEYIHDYNEDFPLTWDIRVRVAVEIAGALFYLHSAASMPIYHRDIKSSNILLDEKYRAKVADFGTSRSLAIDQTHLTTRVHGTFGYMDPEYFQSSQFTDKSDVYSFGVVLVELLTGQKSILAPISDEEGRSLATHFILAIKENRIFDILDPQLVEEGRKEEITTFANIAYRCLNLNGRKRPTMKQVAAELESINVPRNSPTAEQSYEEFEYPVNDQLDGLWELATTSMSSSTSKSVKIDTEPLIGK